MVSKRLTVREKERDTNINMEEKKDVANLWKKSSSSKISHHLLSLHLKGELITHV